MSGRRAFTLIELLVTVSLFSVVALVTFIMMTKGSELWRTSSGQQTASLGLAVADRNFERDLVPASASLMGIGTAPSSLSGAPDGSVVWFLSAYEPATGQFTRKGDGTPFWQRNVIYYLTVPNQHQQLYGVNCSGAPGGSDNDDFCPHKMLIRLVIDSGVATSPSSDPQVTEETLITDVAPYLGRPNGLDVSNLTSPTEVESAQIVATKLLYFEANRTGRELKLDLRATSLDGLGREVQVGAESLGQHSRTFHYLRSFFPKN